MNEEQWVLWKKHIADHRQHRAQYLHLLHLDKDQLDQTMLKAKHMQLQSHMIALRQLIAECDAILAADAELRRLVSAEAVPA